MITQPVTVTDMRRNAKSVLERIRKEKELPIVVHSRVVAVLISYSSYQEIKKRLKELEDKYLDVVFAEAEKEYREGKTKTFTNVRNLIKDLHEGKV